VNLLGTRPVALLMAPPPLSSCQLRGDETAGEGDPPAVLDPLSRSPRPPHSALHRNEQARRCEEVADGEGQAIQGGGEEKLASQGTNRYAGCHE